MSKKIRIKLQKSIATFVAVTTMVWLSGIVAVIPVAQAVVSGDLIRGPDGIKVYVVKDTYKRWIQSPDIMGMYTHFKTWPVNAVDQATLDSYTNAWLVRADGDTKVYEINGDGTKHWLDMTAEQFTSSGRSWAMVYIINTAERDWYTTGPNVLYTVPVTPTAFSVALAADTPASGTLGASSAYNTVIKATISAGSQDRSITGVKAERYGLSIDTNVSGVLLVDKDGVRHGNVVTLSQNQATISFASSPIAIPANTSHTVSIQLHMASTATSGTLGVKLIEVTEAGGATATGLPVTGNLFTLTGTTGVLGTLTADVVSLTTATVNVDVGTKDYVLTKFRLTAGANENVKISKLSLFQNGTAADEDLSNWKLVDPAGVILATATASSGKVITFDLSASPYVLAKGTTKDLSVQVTVAKGSSRTSQVIIQNDYDVVATGASTGLGILATAAGVVDTAFPIGDIASGSAGYNHLTVAAGTLTVVKSTASPSGTFGIGAANITLATWDLEAKGEDIEIQRADIAIGGTTNNAAADNDFAGTVKLMTEAGQTIYSVAAPTGNTSALTDGDAAGTDIVTFATYYTIPANTVLKLKLVVDASTTVTAGETAIGQISDVYFKRVVSNTYGTASAAAYQSGNTLTASAATLTVVSNAAYGNQTIIEGQNDVKLASYLFQTGSSEGVNISSINLDITLGGEAALVALSNLKLKRADTSAQLGSTVSSPAATNTVTVSGQLNIPANTTIQIDAYVNMTTAASDGGTNDTYSTNIDASDVSGTGATSGTSVTAPSATVTAQTITAVEGGTLTASIESSGAASSQFYTPGLSGVEMARVKLAATVEDMKLEKLVLRTVRGSGNVAKVKLLGTGLATDPSVDLTAGDATFTFSTGSEITVPAYGSRVLTAVVNTTTVGTLIGGSLGVVGFGTADARGAGSGIITQERLTGTVCTAGTACGTLAAGDVIYFTVAGDGTATTDDTPGFKMITAVTNNALIVANSLDLEGTANNSWVTGDLVTEVTATSTEIDADNDSENALAVGDVVYFYGDVAGTDNSASTGWHVVTTASAANAGTIVLDGANVAIDAGDGIARFANASLTNAIVGNVMRYEEVEPVMTLATNSPSGSQSPQSEQTVAIYNVKAEGGRDMTFNKLTLEKSGSNSPERYVTKLSLWNGTSKISEVANTTISGTTAVGQTNADTTIKFVAATTNAGELTVGANGVTQAANLEVGDRITLRNVTDSTSATLTVTANDGAAEPTVTFDTTATLLASKSYEVWNFRVHFDAQATATNDTALTEQTITAGQTMTLTVKADTASVKTGVTSGTVTFGVSIPGTAGPLQVGATQIEGLNWDYTELNPLGAAAYKTEADGYPVNSNTLTY